VVTLVVVVTLVAMATFDDDDVIGMTSLELSVNEDFTTLEVKRESGGCVVFIEYEEVINGGTADENVEVTIVVVGTDELIVIVSSM
jgi:hypothetical protein